MEKSKKTEQFVKNLTDSQNRIYGYIYSLLGDHARTADVVQETNLVLWRKLDEFNSESPFLPWAFGIARYQVLANIRDKKRDRFLLDEELVESLTEEAENQAAKLDLFQEAIRPCVKLLTQGNQRIVEERFYKSKPIASVAESLDRSIGSIKVALVRIRRQLADCVQKRLQVEG
jgi:RNA polymerase sigma-70 factor (ECF subfamily)